MPRKCEVISLKSLAKSAGAQFVRVAAERVTDPLDRLHFRRHYTDRLPSKVRETLVTTLARKFGPHAIFPVFDILVAASIAAGSEGATESFRAIKRLKFYEAQLVDEKFWLDDLMMLYRLMERCNNTKDLEELSLAAKFDRLTEHYYVPLFNAGFPSLIGSMTKLTSFTMIGACDDRVFTTLGRQCPHLTYVDVSESWQVTGKGIYGFIFVNPPISSGKGDTTKMILTDEEAFGDLGRPLNPCVKQMTVINIKDTDVDSTAVATLLLHATEVTSIGGFFYGDNVGVSICKLAARKSDIKLKLHDLYDVCLTEDTIKVVSDVCPQLKDVSTRGHCLPFLKHLGRTENLTIDFDFQNYAHFLDDFLVQKGTGIKSITTTDQPLAIDLAILADSCPNIEEILGKFNGVLTSELELPSLKSARIITECSATAISICQFALSIETLVIKPFAWPYSQDREKLSDAHLLPILSTGASMQLLKYFLVQEPTDLGVDFIRSMILCCPALEILGQLRNFHLAQGRVVTKEGLSDIWVDLQKETASQNLDLKLIPYCDDSLRVNLFKMLSDNKRIDFSFSYSKIFTYSNHESYEGKKRECELFHSAAWHAFSTHNKEQRKLFSPKQMKVKE